MSPAVMSAGCQQLLFHGLVSETNVPKESLKSLQACFPFPPQRYRLTEEQTLRNYKVVLDVCAVAAKKGIAPEMWGIESSQIIALLGIWRKAFDLLNGCCPTCYFAPSNKWTALSG